MRRPAPGEMASSCPDDPKGEDPMATFCTSCGQDVKDGWRFCGVCGAEVSDATAPSTTPAGDFAAPGDTTVIPPPSMPSAPHDPARHASPMDGSASLQPAFERRGLRTLSGWTEGITWCVALVQLPALYFAVQQRNLFDDFQQDESFATLLELSDAEDTWLGFFGFSILLSIASVVLVMIWTYRVYGQTTSLGATDYRLARGFTIGAWFIPVANVVLLSLMFSDLERTTRSEQVPIGRAWKDTATAVIVWLWTAAAVGSFVAIVLAGGTESNEFDVTLDDLDGVINGRLAQNVFTFAATAALAWYVRRVRANTDRVTELAAASPAT